MTVAAPSDKRFRRARITPTQRRRWWLTGRTRLTVMAVIGVLVLWAAVRALTLVLSADALVVHRIETTGHSHLSQGEAQALLEGLRGEHMLTVDMERWRQSLKSSPWVADAAFRRVFPGTIRVFILEREPLGLARVGADLYVIDREGTVIDSYGPNYAELDMPLISGLVRSPASADGQVDTARAGLATRVMDALAGRPDLAAQVAEIDVSDPYNAVVLVGQDATAIRLGDMDFRRRLERYIELAPTLRERVPAIEYVDVRFDQSVYLRPAEARSIVTTTARGTAGAARSASPRVRKGGPRGR